MKIGILTQPLHTNYGGLLQNYALQTVLKRMGHNPATINRQWDRGFIHKLIVIFKRLILRFVFLRKDITPIIPVGETKEERNLIRQHTDEFIKKELIVTRKMDSSLDITEIKKHGFDAYIVGSDQVWRPIYSPHLPTYFLDFLQKNNTVKKIAYAASFGVDDWELSRKQTQMAQKLIKQFDAVSVREDSGVKLCEERLNRKAIHVLDPTLLLNKEDYIDLIRKHDTKKSPGNLFVYVLDRTEEKYTIIQRVADDKKLVPFEVMPLKSFGQHVNINDCVYPPVYQWIRSFMDAEFVITDSFHGSVFSIIFNKPFIAIGNAGRGLTRFTSLLKLFHLDKQLILSLTELDKERINPRINFEEVNHICKQYQAKSVSFLEQALKR